MLPPQPPADKVILSGPKRDDSPESPKRRPQRTPILLKPKPQNPEKVNFNKGTDAEFR